MNRYLAFIIIFFIVIGVGAIGAQAWQQLEQEISASSIAITAPDKVEEFTVGPTVLGETVDFSPASLPALMECDFNGRNLTVGQALATTDRYTRYYITYGSGELTISGIMNVPRGDGPFSLLILNHGHIDTSVYTNGRGLKREQDYLARQGYVVIHPDYRNHAQSSKDNRDTLAVRLGYVEDVINAVYAVRAAELPYVDEERIGMLGHSMGGGITLSALVVEPDLIDAAVLYAPVSGDMRLSYERWIERDSNNAAVITKTYGSPEQAPQFWDDLSAETFYDRIKAPVRIFHGTADDSVPLGWSQDTLDLLRQTGVEAELTVYSGAPHEFISDWSLFMQDSAMFFRKHLDNVNI